MTETRKMESCKLVVMHLLTVQNAVAINWSLEVRSQKVKIFVGNKPVKMLIVIPRDCIIYNALGAHEFFVGICRVAWRHVQVRSLWVYKNYRPSRGLSPVHDAKRVSFE